MCIQVTIFSTGGKFQPVLNFTYLCALTPATCSYALLVGFLSWYISYALWFPMSPYFQQPVALCSLYLHQMARLHGLGFVCQAALYMEVHCCRCTGDIQQFSLPRITKVALNLTHFAILLDQDPYHLSHNLYHKCTLSFVTIM